MTDDDRTRAGTGNDAETLRGTFTLDIKHRRLEIVVPGWVRRESVLLAVLEMVLCVVGESLRWRFENIYYGGFLGAPILVPWHTWLVFAVPTLVWWLLGVTLCSGTILKDKYLSPTPSRRVNLALLILVILLGALEFYALAGPILELQRSLGPPWQGT